MMNSKLFTPASIGPLTLRNRTIRSAAFESMCPGNAPSRQLKDYHCSVAAGGVGMTTIAYAAVTQSGLSFDRQLWMRPEIIPGLREITDAVHKEGAAASIQLGHCGNMSHKSICGVTPVGASSGFNLYSPTFVRGLRKEELPQMAKAYVSRLIGHVRPDLTRWRYMQGMAILSVSFFHLTPIIVRTSSAARWRTVCALWIW